MKRLEEKVFGVVQGVFYRAFLKNEAKKLGLVGEARNLSDGSVQIIAEGTEEVLQKFLDSFEKGHPYARVERIEKVWSEARGNFSGFSYF